MSQPADHYDRKTIKMIKNIVFDLGGVLVDWDPRYLYRKIFQTEEEVEFFLENICTYTWNLEQDRGRTLAEATQERIQKFPEYADKIKAYYGRWDEMFTGTIPENVELLNDLLKDDRWGVYALTNWSRETFPIAQKLFPFFDRFHGVVMSGEEKVIKPDPAIYKILFQRYGLKPEESVFIDDRLENIEGAIAMGMKGIHFTPRMDLRAELMALLSSS